MKKILSFALAALICLPMVLVFNNNEDAVYINIIGFIYAYIIIRFKVIPKDVIDYFKG